MQASVITGGARRTLIDADAATWSDDELRDYLTEAERTVVFLKPEAYTVREYIPLVAGTRQQLPGGSVALLNLGENEESGRVATQVDRDLLDHANRFHPAATQQVDVEHWCSDARDPTRFDITPPNDGTGSIEALYGLVPPELNYQSQAINLPDSYQMVLECLVLSRAYAKNTLRQDLAKSDGYYQRALQLLGIKSTAQAAVAPRTTQSAGG